MSKPQKKLQLKSEKFQINSLGMNLAQNSQPKIPANKNLASKLKLSMMKKKKLNKNSTSVNPGNNSLNKASNGAKPAKSKLRYNKNNTFDPNKTNLGANSTSTTNTTSNKPSTSSAPFNQPKSKLNPNNSFKPTNMMMKNMSGGLGNQIKGMSAPNLIMMNNNMNNMNKQRMMGNQMMNGLGGQMAFNNPGFNQMNRMNNMGGMGNMRQGFMGGMGGNIMNPNLNNFGQNNFMAMNPMMMNQPQMGMFNGGKIGRPNPKPYGRSNNLTKMINPKNSNKSSLGKGGGSGGSKNFSNGETNRLAIKLKQSRIKKEEEEKKKKLEEERKQREEQERKEREEQERLRKEEEERQRKLEEERKRKEEEERKKREEEERKRKEEEERKRREEEEKKRKEEEERLRKEQEEQKKREEEAERQRLEEEAKQRRIQSEALGASEDTADQTGESSDLVSDLRKEFGDEDEDAAADNASDDDSDSYSSAEEVENYDDLPQERPKRVRYTKKMIMEFIKKESKKKFDHEYIFEDLTREITKLNVAGGTDAYFAAQNRDRRGGRRNGGYKGRRGYRDDYRKGGGGGRYGDRYNNSGYTNASHKAPGQGLLSRPKMDEDKMKKLREIKGGASENWAENNQKNTSEDEKIKRSINLKLFQLTAENFEACYRDLKKHCDLMSTCEILIALLVDKAWTQPKYTKIYAKMCTKLGSNLYSWAEGADEEKKKSDCKKRFKSMVVTKIRKEFLYGFKKFKEQMIAWQKDEEVSEDEMFEKYLKGKKKLTGNMNFISELYLLSYLPHKVMRFITNKLIIQFTEEFVIRKNIIALKFPVYNEYMDALIKLFQFSGNKIHSREKKHYEKIVSEGKTEKFPQDKVVQLCDYLVDSCKKNHLRPDEKMRNMIDEAKKEANCMDLTFTFMHAMVDGGILDARMSSLVANLQDRKDSGWKKLDRETDGPKKLKEFHEDFERKKQQKRRRYDDRGGYDRGRRNPYDDGSYYKKKTSFADRRNDYDDNTRSSYRKAASKYDSGFESRDEYSKKDSKRG